MLRRIRRTVLTLKMIEPGDRVMIAVSGGADSLTMSWLLLHRKNQWLKYVNFFPVHIEQGYSATPAALDPLKEFFDSLGHPLRIEYRNIAGKVFGGYRPFKPCFTCSRLRRKALFETAEAIGTHKIALAHHRDDVIESFLMGIFFSREIATMMPVQPLFQGRYHIVRPLYTSDEDFVKLFAKRMGFPVMKAQCPYSGNTERQFMKDLLEQIYHHNPKIKLNIFRSLFYPKEDYLLGKYQDILKLLL